MHLAIPAGEAQSERDFSFTGHNITKTRSSLSPSTVEDMLLIWSWAKKPTYSFDKVVEMAEKLIDENRQVKGTTE